jgi:hypothetical protein
VSDNRLQALVDIGNNAAITRPEGVLQESAARRLTDLCADAIGALESPQGLDDIEAMRLRKEARERKKNVHDEYLLTLFDSFDALLKKRD